MPSIAIEVERSSVNQTPTEQQKPLIDNRPNINNNRSLLNTSLQENRIESISPQVKTIIQKIDDPNLGIVFVKKAIELLGFAQVASIAQWAVAVATRQGGNAGKLFVSVANKEVINKAT